MATFRFRLAAVLDHRERIERARALDHARAVGEHAAAARVSAELGARRDAARALFSAERSPLGMDSVRAVYAHLDALERLIDLAQRRVDACGADREDARGRLVEAARSRGVLSALARRSRAAFVLAAMEAEEREEGR